MYKNTFQGASFLEILSPKAGVDHKSIAPGWRRKGGSGERAFRREFDNTARTYVLILEGHPNGSVRITFPYYSKQSLGLIQEYLVLQVFVPAERDFTFELVCSDIGGGGRKSLKFSTFYKVVEVGTTHARVPLECLLRDKWLNLCVPVSSLVSDLWSGERFGALDAISICANCSLRRVFTLKSRPLDTSGLLADDGSTASTAIPKQCMMLQGVECVTQLLTLAAITSAIVPDEQLIVQPPLQIKTVTSMNGTNYTEKRLEKRRVNQRQMQNQMTTRTEQVLSAYHKPHNTATADGNRYYRSASLPRIGKDPSGIQSRPQSAVGIGGTMVANGVNSRRSPTTSNGAPKLAWRGASAHRNQPKSTAPPPYYRRPPSRSLRKDSLSRSDASLEAVSTMHQILSYRLAEVMDSPDDLLIRDEQHASSDNDEEIVVRGNNAAFPPRPVIVRRPSYSKGTVLGRLSNSAETNDAGWLTKGLLHMDADEAEMLASMRRSHLADGDAEPMTPQKNADGQTRSVATRLSQHHYDDDSPDEFLSEEDEGIGPEGWKPDRYSPAQMDGVRGFSSSLSQSQLSQQLRMSDVPPLGGARPWFHQQKSVRISPLEPSAMHEAHRRRLSQPVMLPQNGATLLRVQRIDPSASLDLQRVQAPVMLPDAEDDACPVFECIFDPDLNCYYHPETKKYYQITN